MDMWPAYMESSRAHIPQADIVHDKFHCAKELGKAVDTVRKKEHREPKAEQQGESVLNKTKFIWLKNPDNWTDSQRDRFNALKIDAFEVGRATHSRLKPIIEAARILKRHLPGLLTYCKHRITNAVAAGMNSRIQLIKANARGFRNFEKYRISILFHCGQLDLYPLKSR